MTDHCYTGLVSGDDPFPLTRHALDLLADGEPVPPPRLARAAGLAPAEAERLLHAFPRVDWDASGALVGLGLTLRPTPHRLRIRGHAMFTWCAMDTLLFPLILGEPAEVESACPATGKTIRLNAAPAGLSGLDPATAVVSESLPPGPVSDVRSQVCDHGYFFASAAAAAGWRDEHPGGCVRPVAEAFAQCRAWATRIGWPATRTAP